MLKFILGSITAVGLVVGAGRLGVDFQKYRDHKQAIAELAVELAKPHDAIGIIQIDIDKIPVLFLFLDDTGRYASVPVGGCLANKECASEFNRLARADKIDEIAIHTHSTSNKCIKLGIRCQPTST